METMCLPRLLNIGKDAAGGGGDYVDIGKTPGLERFFNPKKFIWFELFIFVL